MSPRISRVLPCPRSPSSTITRHLRRRRHNTLGGRYDSSFTAPYAAFREKLGRKYGSTYFRWNVGYTVVALAASVIAFVIAATQIVNWTLWHTLAIVALVVLNMAFMYLMPAPTVKGQEVRSEIEGFRLYMETAEKLQLNAATPGSQSRR